MLKMINKKRWPWILTMALMAVQLIVVLLLLPVLARELNWLVILIPVIIALLLIGSYKRIKTAYILTFVWSILLLVHAIILIVLRFHYAYIIYLAFAAVFIIAVSQTSLK